MQALSADTWISRTKMVKCSIMISPLIWAGCHIWTVTDYTYIHSFSKHQPECSIVWHIFMAFLLRKERKIDSLLAGGSCRRDRLFIQTAGGSGGHTLGDLMIQP